jgi:signal peptidase I
MAAVLIACLCLLFLLGLAVNGLFLWLSCIICRVARPPAAPGGKARGVGYGRALLSTLGLLVVGNLIAAAFLYLAPPLRLGVSLSSLPALLPFIAADEVITFGLCVILLRFALPTSLGRAALVLLVWHGLSVLLAAGIFFGVRYGAAEAFVVPTGSMAETLIGYHKDVVCPECGYAFPVNASQQAEPTLGQPEWVAGCICPNCRRRISFTAGGASAPDPGAILDPAASGGDRFAVGRGLLGADMTAPRRMDCIAFEPPGAPLDPHPSPGGCVVKRLAGLPGESPAIHGGDLYILAAEKGPKFDSPGTAGPKASMHVNDPETLQRFTDGKFEIVRKSPDNILAMERIVYDDDHQARDLAGVQMPRWADRGPGGWADDGKNCFRLAAPADDAVHWLGYRHLLRDEKMEADVRKQRLDALLKRDKGLRDEARRQLKEMQPGEPRGHDLTADRLPPAFLDTHLPAREDVLPQLREAYAKEPSALITDFLGYNTWEGRRTGGPHLPGENWVGDLILECDAQADQPKGQLTLELSKGMDRFRARFDLASGDCKLLRVHDAGKKGEREEELACKPTGFKGGSHHVRLANVDRRLTVWVDGNLPFGDGVAYSPPEDEGPSADNDLEPAGIGVRGAAAAVHGLKLWRDVYYTTARHDLPSDPDGGFGVNFSKPDTWGPLGRLPVKTFYVPPDCYFLLGDNSTESSDSRWFGPVPRRLLLGKAFLVYYPLDRAGWIH